MSRHPLMERNDFIIKRKTWKTEKFHSVPVLCACAGAMKAKDLSTRHGTTQSCDPPTCYIYSAGNIRWIPTHYTKVIASSHPFVCVQSFLENSYMVNGWENNLEVFDRSASFINNYPARKCTSLYPFGYKKSLARRENFLRNHGQVHS